MAGQLEEIVDLRELSPLSLAFVGDSVLELLVRQRLVQHSRMHPGRLNAEKVKYVSARAQYREMKLLEPVLTEDELTVFKRGRNATKASVSKHATAEEYRASTGLECLLGWLFLSGREQRVNELFELVWSGFDPDADAAEEAARKAKADEARAQRSAETAKAADAVQPAPAEQPAAE